MHFTALRFVLNITWAPYELANSPSPQKSSSQSMLPRPAVLAAPGNLLEMQLLRSHPRSTESKTLGLGPVVWILTLPPGDTDTCWNLRITSSDSCHFAAHKLSPRCKKLLSVSRSLASALLMGLYSMSLYIPFFSWSTPSQLLGLSLEGTSSRKHCPDCPGWIQCHKALYICLGHILNCITV